MSKLANKPALEMTVREKVAAMALQGMLAKGSSIIWAEQIMDAKIAVAYTDALIAELEKDHEQR